MFAGDLILFGLPGSLIILSFAFLVVTKLKLMPAGMSFDWLILQTIGLGAGGIMIGFMIEDFVIWPHQLQDELAHRQYATPLELRSFSMMGFQDMQVIWIYEIDPAEAAQLSQTCRPDQDPRMHFCHLAGIVEEGPATGDGRSGSITLEGTTLTLEEDVF